jgi:hypothetical protein
MGRVSLYLIPLIVLSFVKSGYAHPSSFKIYGFFDLELEVSNKDPAGRLWTFDQHHFNLITIFHLDKRFRVFGEIEWEHGFFLEGGEEASGEFNLERAWLEYKYSDAFKIKVGKFLAPFGIYNLVHDATPTYLSTLLPNPVYGKHTNTIGEKQKFYSKFATGIQILGSLFIRDWECDYYIYMSNGRGADPGEKDENSNKGVGGRFVIFTPLNIFKLGTSYYADKNGNARNTTQKTFGVDAEFEYMHLNLHGEIIQFYLEKVDTNGIPNGEFRRGRGYYLQGSYSLFDKLTPFLRYEFFDPDLFNDGDGEYGIVVGINFSASPRVILKNEVHFNRFQDEARNPYEHFIASLAVAF